jgi:hypothetical protein
MLTTGNHKLTPAVVILAGDYTGQNGKIYKHKVTFTNGDYGEYHSKSETQSYFVKDKEVEFECEVKTNGTYTNYKIKPIKDNPNGKPGFFGGGNNKAVLAAAALNASIVLYQNKEITKDDIQNVTKNFYQFLSGLTG